MFLEEPESNKTNKVDVTLDNSEQSCKSGREKVWNFCSTLTWNQESWKLNQKALKVDP